jgi:hypothetical protein
MAELPRDRPPLGRELQARFGEGRSQGLKAASRRWLAVSSLPAWVQAAWGVLPDIVAFWGVLIQGAFLVSTVVFAVLEHRWRERGLGIDAGSSPMEVPGRWSSWDDLRSALWSGLALISLVPWAYVAFGRPVPRPILSGALAVAGAVLLLLVAAETLSRLGRTDSTR